jgi:hypothetical protein
MKSTSGLLIAFSLASSAVFAQSQSQQVPPSSASPGAQTQYDSPASGTSGGPAAPGAQGAVQTRPRSPGAQPGSPPGTNSSGASGSGASGTDSTLSGGSGSLGTQSGSQSGMPPHPTSGTSGTQPATGMSAPSLPPAGAQPEQAPPAPGASGTSGMQSSSAPTPGGGAEPSIAALQPRTENGVTYVCGGVGKEEASYMKKEAGKHDLALTFAAKDGEFLADVNVAIMDAKGNPVLETRCGGPMMLVDLPRRGTYRIHAETAGHGIDRTVSVSKGRGGKKVASAVLTWPTSVARADETGGTASGNSGTGGQGGQGSGGERRW